MSLQVITNDDLGRYPYLDISYPAPFTYEGIRWKCLYSFFEGIQYKSKEKQKEFAKVPISQIDEVDIEGEFKDIDQKISKPEEYEDIDLTTITLRDIIVAKGILTMLNANPLIAEKILNTRPKELDIRYEEYPNYGIILQYIRDKFISKKNLDQDNEILYANLISILKMQGFKDVDNIPRNKDIRALSIHGSYTDIEVEDVVDQDTGKRRKRKVSEKEKTIHGILDIFINEKFSENRIKQVIKDYLIDRDKDEFVYIIVADIPKKNFNKYMRYVAYNNIRIFTKNELYVTPSKHMLCPKIEKVLPGTEEYNLIVKNGTKISEISSNDKLVKEKAYRIGDILRVDDFSPHYRVVV